MFCKYTSLYFYFIKQCIIENFLGAAANNKAPDKSGKTSEPVQKKLKKKSIFSPENSSESDSGVSAKVSTVKPTSGGSAKTLKNPPAKTKLNETKQKSASRTGK